MKDIYRKASPVEMGVFLGQGDVPSADLKDSKARDPYRMQL